MQKATAYLRTVLTVVLFVLLPLAVFTLITSKTGVLGGIRSFTVASGSMSPTLPVGSVIYTVRQVKYVPGDIVAAQENSVTVTHRISRSLDLDNSSFELKGDANSDPDARPVAVSQIIGREFLAVPLVGYLSGFLKTPIGFLLLIILPSLALIVSEIFSIKKELESQIEKKIKRNLGIPVGAAILAATLFLSSLPTTYSFFSDSGQSTSNIFTASQSFPGNHIVINEVFYFIDNGHKIGNSESGSEWAEIFNPTGGPVSLAGWSVSDNVSCDDIPGSPSVPANGFAILTTKTETDFRAVWTTVPGGVIFIQSPSAIGNGLANNDRLILRNGTCPSGGSIVDQISWGSDTTALNPSIPTTARGHSSERNPDGKDTDTAGDFIEQTTPTPGS